MDAEYHEWAHSPSHLFKPNAFYFVTAGTYGRQKYFDTPEKRDFLLHSLFEEARLREWRFEAWVVFSNHYHFVAMAPDDARTLRPMLLALHSKTAIWLNKLDNKAGRRVWHQYRDTCLTHERSYLARLNYVCRTRSSTGLCRMPRTTGGVPSVGLRQTPRRVFGGRYFLFLATG